MERVLGRFSPQLYAVMRIVVGLLFACHGAQKLFGVLGGQQAELASKFGVAGIIELVGGVMIAIGFLTGTAAFIASGEMAYAYFTAHMPKGGAPIQNGGELAVLYCFVFLYIASRGVGIWGVDKRTRI
ncbi:MAG TPA: DoxX family protein [Vicinamibacterales bacterium]|jgi:putative oxidoreductase|nr:DoxX family protein [Vicinamibacterales bacterium]